LTFLLFRWAFRHLTGEKWQFLAAIPMAKTADAGWQGLNLTYYGVFNATAYTLACTLLIVLTAAIGIPVSYTLALLVLILGGCMPGSRLIARLVEKKPHTFSIGGAFFMGLLLTPAIVILSRPLAARLIHTTVNPLALLAAVSIAYCWGEGIGRLACISFGCCYGKPLADVHPLLQKVFRHCNFVFDGSTRKIEYAHGFAGIQVVPVQALTAVIYCCAGLVCMYLFSKSHFTAAFIVSMVVTQAWRFGSEFLRADYRGESRISKYQWMAILAIFYSVIVALSFPQFPAVAPSIAAGLKSLWQPLLILFIQLLWIVVFVYTGRSQVTGSQISFHVITDRI
jgi:prolipoprotein diacylglyceryltransferase